MNGYRPNMENLGCMAILSLKYDIANGATRMSRLNSTAVNLLLVLLPLLFR